MTITKDKVVTIDYSLRNSEGDLLDSSNHGHPLEYLHGHNNVISGLEKELEGKQAADEFCAVITPEDGYGEYDDSLVMDVPRENFPDNIEIVKGTQFEAESPQGFIPVTVVNVATDIVTVDANHPLAGEKLFFSVKVVSVRDATQEELENGLEPQDCTHDHNSCGCDCDGCC
jgi:FKBP-type peptidyl-prolyl cis-trans isomerase SlyD